MRLDEDCIVNSVALAFVLHMDEWPWLALRSVGRGRGIARGLDASPLGPGVLLKRERPGLVGVGYKSDWKEETVLT